MSKRKASYHHGDLRRALMDAALATVAEGGVASLSLREAARRAGVSSAAPYHHFASVDALVGALCEEGFAGLAEAMREGIARAGDDPRARMMEMGKGYVRYAVAHPAHFRMMFTMAPPDDMMQAAGDGSSGFELMLGGIQSLQAAGLAPGGSAAPLALMAWASVHGLASLLIDGPLAKGLMGLPSATLDATLVRTFVDGLAALAQTSESAQTIASVPTTSPRKTTLKTQ
jgi:AcrR family transcriptional regulator